MPASAREKDTIHARRVRELERILVMIVASPTGLEGDMINPLADADVAQVIEIVRRSPHASRGAVSRLQAAAAMNTRLRAKAARRVQDGPSRDRESPDAC